MRVSKTTVFETSSRYFSALFFSRFSDQHKRDREGLLETTAPFKGLIFKRALCVGINSRKTILFLWVRRVGGNAGFPVDRRAGQNARTATVYEDAS
jgi:hypothetical protein